MDGMAANPPLGQAADPIEHPLFLDNLGRELVLGRISSAVDPGLGCLKIHLHRKWLYRTHME